MLMDLAGPLTAAGQLQVDAARVRLAELSVGRLYRVTVTNVLPGKAELLIGNQYLLAATQLKFQPGDVVHLLLAARTPELLTFRLALPAGAAAEQSGADLAVLARAAGLSDTAPNRAAVQLLLSSGIPLSARTAGEVLQLMQGAPMEAVAAFMPLYKELLEKGLRLRPASLLQVAKLSGETPELSGLLAGALSELRGARESRRRRALQEAIEGALTVLEDEDQPLTAELLKDRLRALYGSPEKTLRNALLSREGDEPADEAPKSESELGDLVNLALGEEVPAGLAVALSMLEAQRAAAALTGDSLNFALPLVLDGEPTEVSVSIDVLAEQYYQKDYSVRLRVSNRTQGEVEFQLRTRGPGLYVDVLAARSETARVYQEQLTRFVDGIQAEAGLIVRRADVTVQSL